MVMPGPRTSTSREEVERLRDEFFREVRPANFLERMYANEFVDLAYEVQRLRRMKAAMIDSLRPVALKNVLALAAGRLGSREEEHRLATEYLSGDLAARERVTRLLDERGLDQSAIEAEAFGIRSKDFIDIEAMIVSKENRRDKALLKIVDLRSCYAGTLFAAANKVIEHAETSSAEGEATLMIAAE